MRQKNEKIIDNCKCDSAGRTGGLEIYQMSIFNIGKKLRKTEDVPCMDMEKAIYGKDQIILIGALNRPVSKNESVVLKFESGAQIEGIISAIFMVARGKISTKEVESAGLRDRVDLSISVKFRIKSECLGIWKYKQNDTAEERNINMNEYAKWDEVEKELNNDYNNGKFARKPAVFVCGATGVGKSSLIYDMFGIGTEIGNSGKSTTRGVNWYESEKIDVWDTEGYEIGDDRQQFYYDKIIGFVESTSKVDEVWYCISAGEGKIFDVDTKVIKEMMSINIPVLIILTKVDLTSEEELLELKKVIEEELLGVSICTYSTECVPEEYVQKEEIYEWSIDNLPVETRAAFVNSANVDDVIKENTVKNHIVAKYTAMAAAVVTGTSIVTVPFTDSVALIALQMKMTSDILQAYGLDNGLALKIVGAKGVSVVGKTLAGQIAGLIPWFGPAAKAAVNVTVATTITATLGLAVSHWAQMQVKNGGVDTLFSSEELEDAYDWAESNGMVDALLNQVKIKQPVNIVEEKHHLFDRFKKGNSK